MFINVDKILLDRQLAASMIGVMRITAPGTTDNLEGVSDTECDGHLAVLTLNIRPCHIGQRRMGSDSDGMMKLS